MEIMGTKSQEEIILWETYSFYLYNSYYLCVCFYARSLLFCNIFLADGIYYIIIFIFIIIIAIIFYIKMQFFQININGYSLHRYERILQKKLCKEIFRIYIQLFQLKGSLLQPKKEISIPQPHAITIYNNYMGTIDHIECLIQKYRIAI